jgi:hypothetical protein
MARWTDLAEWVGPTVNEGDGDGTPLESEDHLIEVRGLVLHTAEGYFKGTEAWQQNKDANVSSHFIVAGLRDAPYGVPDGKLAQMVDTADRAWTQQAGNSRWLSLECSGFGSRGDKLSPGQLEAAAQLLARAHTVYGVPLQVANDPTQRGLGHHSMDREGIDPEWGHDDCPGTNIIAQKPLIVARAIEIIGGDDMSWFDEPQYRNRTGEQLITDLWYTAVDPAGLTRSALTEIQANLAALAGKDWVDEETIVNGVLAGLAAQSADEIAQRLAELLGPELGAQVVSALGAKLTAPAG